MLLDESELAVRTAAILKATEALQNEMLLGETATLPSGNPIHYWTSDRDRMRTVDTQTTESLSQLPLYKAPTVSIGIDCFAAVKSTGSQYGEGSVGSQRNAASQTSDRYDDEDEPNVHRPSGVVLAAVAASPSCHSAAVQTDRHLVKSTSTDPIALIPSGVNTNITGEIVECAALAKVMEKCMSSCARSCEEHIGTRLNAIKQQVGLRIEPSVDRAARLVRRGIAERASLARELAMLKVDWLNATRDLEVTAQLQREADAEVMEWRRKYDGVAEELHSTQTENLQLRQKVEVLEKVVERLERPSQIQEPATRQRHSNVARSMSSSESEHDRTDATTKDRVRGGHRQGKPPRYSPADATPSQSPHPNVPPVTAIAAVVARKEQDERMKLLLQLYQECEDVLLDDA